MNTMVADSKQYDLCGQVIGAAMKVHSILGPGFLESVYQNALVWELQKSGFKVDAQRPITVKPQEVQLVNYLVATGIDEGLLVNFGAQRLEYKRKFRLPKQEKVSL